MNGEEMKHCTHVNNATDKQWQAIVKLAWRPAWSMRSRKGCFAPFIAWWRQCNDRAG
jgi:hypothetical protein